MLLRTKRALKDLRSFPVQQRSMSGRDRRGCPPLVVFVRPQFVGRACRHFLIDCATTKKNAGYQSIDFI
jgi:hypothetical protein